MKEALKDKWLSWQIGSYKGLSGYDDVLQGAVVIFPSQGVTVYFSGGVANIPHLLVSQKRSQKPNGECRKKRTCPINLRQEARAAAGEVVAPCLLLLQAGRDPLLLRVVTLLVFTNFTFI